MANSVILTFYFSGILSGFSSKHTQRKDGFLLSLSGSTVGAVFSIISPYLPEALSFLDVAVVFVLVTWVALLHYRYDEGWPEAILEAVLGGIIYAVIMVLLNGFLILWIGA
jgi:riboflavin transporter FmnP